MGEDTVLDLSGSVPLQSGVLEIKLQGGKLSGWKIELAGPAHAKSIALSQEVTRERIAKEARQEQAQVNGRKYKAEEEDVDDRARRNVTRLVQRMLGWSPNPLFRHISPEPIVFSEKTAVDLLLRPDMSWALEQIADYFSSESAFMPASATA